MNNNLTQFNITQEEEETLKRKNLMNLDEWFVPRPSMLDGDHNLLPAHTFDYMNSGKKRTSQ